MSAISIDNLTIERTATDAQHVRRGAGFVALLVMFGTICAVTWRQPVTSMPMNRNDAAFYLVLAHNLVEHGVYSHQQSAPFAPHTEWPPGVPLWYSAPMSLLGEFPVGASAWIIHAWTWMTAMLAAWLVFRYLRLFVTADVALAITAATIFSRAFLDEAQAAFADIPALAASFLVLFEIERHFAMQTPSRWRHVGLLVAMSLLPLVKPYLGIVFVAYLWKAIKPAQGVFGQLSLVVGRVALCCLPFIGFMTYSVVAARESGTISAVTWLTTDNAVAQREGVAAADPKSPGEWLSGTIATIRFHLVDHVAEAPMPMLDRFGLRDWATVPRWGVIGTMLALLAIGVGRALRRREAAAAAYLLSMLAVFAVLGCDSARYFIILTPLCAWMIWEGIGAVVGHRQVVQRLAPAAVLLLAVGSGVAWSRERQAATWDVDPLFQDVYATLFELRDRGDVTTLAVPYPLRELAIVETGKRVWTHSEYLERSDAERSDVTVLVIDRTSGRAPGFVTPNALNELLAESPVTTMIRNASARVVVRRTGGHQTPNTSQ